MRTSLRNILVGVTTAGLLVACELIAGIDQKTLAPNNPVADGGDAATQPDSSVAVDSGGGDAVVLGPPGCFTGTPTTDLQFLNQCTTSQFLPFDNCGRLGFCDGGYDPDALIAPPPPAAAVDSGLVLVPPAVDCKDVSRPNLVFMQGSTNFTSFIQAMAPLVAAKGYTIVWQPTSSCAGAGAGGFDPAKLLMKNPTTVAGSYASYYGADGVGVPCLLDPAGETTTVGQSDIFATSCGNDTWVPGAGGSFPNVGHYLGPVQAMVLVTPPASTQRVISAEAAHVVFGMGGNGGASKPWIDPDFMWIRSSTTGTNNIISRGIDVPPTKWWGIDKKTAPAMRDAILTVSSAEAEKTIGTLSIDFADKSKTSLHIMYFQAKGQLAGFLPDSLPSSADKQNVRDGHYDLWGPIHLYTAVSGGQPSAAAAAFILPFSTPNKALLDATISGGQVPICAMGVSRDTEMGPIKTFSPDFQCDCYYNFKVSGGNSCKTCAGAADCPATAPACNIGYCQAH